MTAEPWDWKVPVLNGSRWQREGNLRDATPFKPLLGIYCDDDHDLWLVGSFRRTESGWIEFPFYPTGDGMLAYVPTHSQSSERLYNDQTFRVPDPDLPLEEWIDDLEAGRPTGVVLTEEELATMTGLQSRDEKHVWLNNWVMSQRRERSKLRCGRCPLNAEIRLRGADDVIDLLAAHQREVSLRLLRMALNETLEPPRRAEYP